MPGYAIFERVFWAFGPSIEGFQHCRPVISIDRTFLYGKYKGTLPIASTWDGDNRLFPLAFAIVEKETDDNPIRVDNSIRVHISREALSRELLAKRPLNQFLKKNTKMHFEQKLKARKYKITFKNI